MKKLLVLCMLVVAILFSGKDAIAADLLGYTNIVYDSGTNYEIKYAYDEQQNIVFTLVTREIHRMVKV